MYSGLLQPGEPHDFLAEGYACSVAERVRLESVDWLRHFTGVLQTSAVWLRFSSDSS